MKGTSTFAPPAHRNKVLDAAINYLKSQTFDTEIKNAKSNLSRSERDGLKKLKENKDIIIKEADKGGCVVIMNRSHYQKMVMDQLGNVNTYKITTPKCDKKVMTKLERYVTKYKSILSDKERTYLTKFQPKTSNFYGLPKIHKSLNIMDAIKEQNSDCINILEPQDLKLRPIVAGPSCPTRPLSNFVDIIIKPLLLHVKSYIKDSMDFLNKCSRHNSPDTILATFDITSLYTSIPHQYGLEAMRYWLENYRASVNPRFTTEFILEGIELILSNNNFCFNDTFYEQLLGTAMGSIFAPTYAGLVVGYLELKFYSLVEIKWGKTLSEFIADNWCRFLDDCNTLLDKKKIPPEELLKVLNSINPNIQFTLEYSDKGVPFLDILIKRDGGIWMDLYQKPTDTQRYVPFNSNHPPHCKKNIPFTLARRICTIVENQERKEFHLNNLRKNLKQQTYPVSIIENGITKALKIPQTELRKPKTIEENEEKNIPFISTYNPNNPQISNTIKSVFENLQSNTVPGFKDVKLIQSRRQAPNLKRILTKAEFSSKKPSVQKCGDPRCQCCNNLLLADHYVFKRTGFRFVLKTSFTCDSSNLLYVLICDGCGEEYIGETGEGVTVLRDRVRVYRQHIKDKTYQMLDVEGHVRQCGKGGFKIFPFLQMKSKDTALRKSFEKKFQLQFKCTLN